MNRSTDNLYKFCALAGVVIGLFALYVPYRFADDLSLRSGPLVVETRRSEIEANHLSQQTEQLNKAIQAQTQTGADGKTVKTYSDKELKEAQRALDESQLKLNIQYAEIKAANLELKRLHNQTVAIAIIGLAVFAFGVGLAQYGISNWYLKIQAIQNLFNQTDLDKLLSEKSGKKRAANDPIPLAGETQAGLQSARR